MLAINTCGLLNTFCTICTCFRCRTYMCAAWCRRAFDPGRIGRFSEEGEKRKRPCADVWAHVKDPRVVEINPERSSTARLVRSPGETSARKTPVRIETLTPVDATRSSQTSLTLTRLSGNLVLLGGASKFCRLSLERVSLPPSGSPPSLHTRLSTFLSL